MAGRIIFKQNGFAYNPDMDRRKFLVTATSAAAVLSFFPWRWASALSPSTGPTHTVPLLRKFGNFRLVYLTVAPGSEERYLCIHSSKSQRPVFVPLGLTTGHFIDFSPTDKNICAISESFGTKACIVNLKAGKVTARFNASDEVKGLFDGHLCFTPDGKHLLTVEYPKDHSGPGEIVIRNATTLAVERKLETGFHKPHQITFTADKKHLLVGHYGKRTTTGIDRGGVSVFRYPDFAPLKEAWFSAPDFGPCHFDFGKDGALYFSTRITTSSSNELPAPHLTGKRTADAYSWSPLPLKPEFGSFLYNFTVQYSHKTDHFIVAHTKSCNVSIWKRGLSSPAKVLNLGNNEPLGLAESPSGDHVFIGTKSSKLFVLETKSWQVIETHDLPGIGLLPHFRIQHS